MQLRQTGFRVTTTLAVLVFAGSGIAMLVRHEHITADMKLMGYPAFFLSILGAWKVLGAVTVALPGLPRLKEWAYAGMIFDLTGAALSRVLGGFGVEHAVPPMMICGAVLASWALRPVSRRLASPGDAPRGLRFPVAAR
jgi:hypothetical protein